MKIDDHEKSKRPRLSRMDDEHSPTEELDEEVSGQVRKNVPLGAHKEIFFFKYFLIIVNMDAVFKINDS